VNIRTYRPGDEEAQAAIYNEAAAGLAKFKPATSVEVRRRCRARDFDPSAYFFAEKAGQVVGYATFQAHGRVSFPWCRPGHEDAADPLFQKVLETMQARGHQRAFAAYRGDWPLVDAFFEGRGFRRAREIVNFVLDLPDMPTPPAKMGSTIDTLRESDFPAILAMGRGTIRVQTPADLAKHLLDNPYFPGDSVFVLRDQPDGGPLGVGLLIEEESYADPKMVDSAMPCFRLGAFGTEGLSTKRINGMFSFLTPAARSAHLALDLLGHAAFRVRQSDLGTFAAQVPSDVPHLFRFYQSHFRRQGSFPVFEKELVRSPY
jgi:hypothetical protein